MLVDRDTKKLDLFVAPDFVGHFGSVTLNGPAEYREYVEEIVVGISDVQFEVLAMLVQRDMVAVRFRIAGIHTEPIFGTAPTGELLDVDATTWMRIENGLIVELWASNPFAHMLETLLKKANSSLEKAVANIKMLEGLLPICASCKKIRNDKNNWQSVETYIAARAEVQFTHGICPECRARLYPELESKATPEG